MRDTHGSRDSWEASTPRRAGGEDEWELTPATVHILQLHHLYATLLPPVLTVQSLPARATRRSSSESPAGPC
jgi:hypothetical protein